MSEPTKDFRGPTGFLFTPDVVTLTSRIDSGFPGYPPLAPFNAVEDQTPNAGFVGRQAIAITGIHLTSYIRSGLLGGRLGVSVGLSNNALAQASNSAPNLLISHLARGVAVPQEHAFASSIMFPERSAFRVLSNRRIIFFWTYTNIAVGPWSIDATAQIYYVPLAYGQTQSGP